MSSKVGQAVQAADSELEKVLAGMNLTEEQKAMLRKAKQSEGRSRRVEEKEILAKYPHAVAGTLSFDTVANKQRIKIACQHAVDGKPCGVQREVFTSDLFQVKVCEPHKKAERDAVKAARKELFERFKKAQSEAKGEVAPAETPAEPQEA